MRSRDSRPLFSFLGGLLLTRVVDICRRHARPKSGPGLLFLILPFSSSFAEYPLMLNFETFLRSSHCATLNLYHRASHNPTGDRHAAFLALFADCFFAVEGESV